MVNIIIRLTKINLMKIENGVCLMKKIPYGISNFKRLISGDMYYVDKTKYIEKLEQKEDFQFFIRPRRFGKTLFLSMLATYYGPLSVKGF